MTDLHDVDAWRAHLRRGLVEAMRARNATATRALRAALAAVDNAEAPNVDTAPCVDAGGVVGAGAGDVAPLHLTAADVESIVLREVASRRSAADEYERLHQHEHARALRDEAGVLAEYLPDR